MKYLLAFLTFAAGLASATTIDLTAGGTLHAYPDYLDRSCGGVTLTVLSATVANDITTASVSAFTSCSTGGRGTKPRRFLACWTVTADANGVLLSRELGPTASWLQGQAPVSCPTGS